MEKYFGGDYDGTLIHDCWSAQNNTTAKSHQLCHPHLLRDLIFCMEIEKSKWAYKALRFLLSSEKARKHIWQESFDPLLKEKIIKRYDEMLQKLINEAIADNNIKGRKLQKRFRKHYLNISIS